MGNQTVVRTNIFDQVICQNFIWTFQKLYTKRKYDTIYYKMMLDLKNYIVLTVKILLWKFTCKYYCGSVGCAKQPGFSIV